MVMSAPCVFAGEVGFEPTVRSPDSSHTVQVVTATAALAPFRGCVVAGFQM